MGRIRRIIISNIPDDFKPNVEFYNFLVDNDTLDKWIYNFKKQKNQTIKNYLEHCDSNIIAGSFRWSDTIEKYYYWKKLNIKYNNSI